MTAKNFLVHKLKISNKEAIALIVAGKLLINNEAAQVNQPIHSSDAVTYNGEILKAPDSKIYIAYYKPRGVESTLNKNIEHNLADALNIEERLFPVGRLDKESEGLLLLTNDGIIFNKILHSDQFQEKEYIVSVDKELTTEAVEKLSTGIMIMGKMTRPAKVKQITSTSFNIVITQGLNRQIRRMCYKLGYEVLQLKRIRIIILHLGDLQPGEWRTLTIDEITALEEIVRA